MRAIKIDPTNKTITECEYTDLESLQEAVGGYIELAFTYPYGHMCFVNEEANLKEKKQFFKTEHAHLILAGDAIIVGMGNDDGEMVCTPCTLDLNFVKEDISWVK